MKKLFYCYYYYLYRYWRMWDNDESSHNWAALMIWFNIGCYFVFTVISFLYFFFNIQVSIKFHYLCITPFLVVGFFSFNKYKNQHFLKYEKLHKDDPNNSLKIGIAFMFCLFSIIVSLLTIPMLR